MAKSSKKTSTTTTKKPAAAAAGSPRKLKTPVYRSFKLQKRIKTATPTLPTGFRLFRTALGTLVRHWKVFLGIIIVYGLLNAVLVGFGSTNGLDEVKQSFNDAFTGSLGGLAAGASLFVYMLGTTSASTNPAAGAYQLILALIISLALIWTLREIYAGHNTRIRDGFYRGMYPLIPFVLVLCVIGLQLVPLLVGGYLLNSVIANSIALTGMEFIIWTSIFFILALVSLYMVSSSLFALYIVSLPDMTPLRALRSARELVRFRRWAVLRKVVFLPIALILLAALLIIPLIMFVTPLAVAVFIVCNMAVVAAVHSYMYALYRSLL